MEFLDYDNIAACEEYESFVSGHKNGSFLQSLKWTGVKSNWDSEAIIVRGDNGKIKGSALVLIKPVPFIGISFLYSPRGPVCDWSDTDTIAEITSGIADIAKRHNAYQFRFDPFILESDTESISSLMELGFGFNANATPDKTIQTRDNYMLNIENRSADEVFYSFHSKWRYNIRLAEKRGVECRVCGKESLHDFYTLMEETGKRDGFCIRKEKYFERMLDALGNNARLYMCYLDSEPLSGAISVQYAGKTCYVYGASSHSQRSAMPNYLMQWSMIQWAIESGCKWYDFQGVPYYWDETHPNYGVYRFKSGFNGEVVTYAGEFYINFSDKIYNAICALKKVKSLLL